MVFTCPHPFLPADKRKGAPFGTPRESFGNVFSGPSAPSSSRPLAAELHAVSDHAVGYHDPVPEQLCSLT